MRVIYTPRLNLIPATRDTTRVALVGDRAELGALLFATVPASWPPELLDQSALEWVMRTFDDPAHDPKWGMYWIILRVSATQRTLVGTAGFKGAPKMGTVEVGYGIVAEHQRRGYATEATMGMLDYAFQTPIVRCVIAETLPGLAPSIGVLEKCGFRFIGEGSEPGVIRYEIRKPDPG